MLYRRLLWPTILLITVGLLNYLCRKRLLYGYADLFSYNQLYGTKDQLRITGIERSGQDSLIIRFDGASITKSNHFEVYCGREKIFDGTSPFLTIRPYTALKTYFIRVNSTDSLHLDIEFPRNSGRPQGLPDVTTSSVVVGSDEPHNLGDWCWNASDTSRIEEVRHYLQDSMNITARDNSREKVVKISRYIFSVTAGRHGTPTDSMAGLNPLDQLTCVRKGLSGVNCNNFATLLSFFSNRAGVPTRFIQTGTAVDGVTNGVHGVNEVYLKENRCWAFVDLTDGIVFVKKKDKFLNVLDIQRLLRYDTGDTLMLAWQYRRDSLTAKDSLVYLPFTEASFFAKQDLHPSNTFIFFYGNYQELTTSRNPMEKIRNFFYPRPFYVLYSDNMPSTNYQFYIRLASTYIFLGVFFVWTGIGLANLLARRRSRDGR